MVLDLLSLIGLPTTIAVVEGARHQKAEETKEEHEQYRMRDFHVDVYCNSDSRKKDQVHGTMVVLKDHNLYLAAKDPNTDQPKPLRTSERAAHPFTGFYLDFTIDQSPEGSSVVFSRLNKVKIPGLVSTIPSSDPNRKTLNWVYLDKNTYEIKYGAREEAQGHILGPWNWTDDEAGLTLEGWEGFVAVEVVRGIDGGRSLWQLYFDRNDDKLKGKVSGKRILEVSLERRVIDDEDDIEEVTRK